MRWQAVAPLSFGLAIAASHASAQPAPAGSEPADAAGTPVPPPEAEAAATTTQPTAPDNATVVAPVPTQNVPVAPPPERPRLPDEGFRFGSYGRAVAGSDLRGGKPAKLLIVAHGPRIVEDSYLELEFSYGFVRPRANDGYIVLRPVITVAFDGTLFHDTGEFDANPAIRNLYLDARLAKNITAWAGSRMYRGDDIYLFDFWPLDDQNTFGGGAQIAQPLDATNEVAVAAHVGFNRLQNEFQFQEIDVANPIQGATTVEQLNRQRIVASATGSYTMLPTGDGMGAKVRVHTEVHTLPSGSRKRDDGTFEALPADSGFLLGAEAGVFGFAPEGSPYRRHLNLFARYSKGLAAFDELAPPTSFGPELKTGNANELSFGLSGNFDHDLGQLMVGALSRRFIDADLQSEDSDDGWEYAVAARALGRIVPDWYVGGEASYQARFPKGLNAITLRADDPALLQIAPMIAFSPMGPSSYDRPQLRLVYRAAKLNQAALDLYVPDDPRHRNEWVHFLGLQAEWWFNSTRYR